ncbi:MAG: pantetheine-phosphate adenylyltransferase [Elusimicrobia bacterium]|nr:pantetheine-phosphate adenylyltransferase [Elusimicrobiota bacterium]
MKTNRRTIIYPGSFDPVTNGHLDIVHRAAQLFDHIVVAVSANSQKSPLFSIEERLDLLKMALRPLIRSGKASVDSFEGLLVHYAARKGAVGIVRGLRAISDFEYEFQMALMNRFQDSRIETVFLMPDEKYTYLSSTLLKEVVRLGGDIRQFIPSVLVPRIQKKLNPKKSQPFVS